MELAQAFEEFGKALGNLKRAYAEEYDKNPHCLMVRVNDDDYIAIVPTDTNGDWIGAYRTWVDTEI